MLPEDGALLRVFIGEQDKHEGRPLHEWLVLEAKKRGLAGATVLRGIMGYGAASRISTTKIERLSQDLPIVVEFVDTRENLETFLELIDPKIHDGMATLEKAYVKFYRSR